MICESLCCNQNHCFFSWECSEDDHHRNLLWTSQLNNTILGKCKCPRIGHTTCPNNLDITTPYVANARDEKLEDLTAIPFATEDYLIQQHNNLMPNR